MVSGVCFSIRMITVCECKRWKHTHNRIMGKPTWVQWTKKNWPVLCERIHVLIARMLFAFVLLLLLYRPVYLYEQTEWKWWNGFIATDSVEGAFKFAYMVHLHDFPLRTHFSTLVLFTLPSFSCLFAHFHFHPHSLHTIIRRINFSLLILVAIVTLS